MPQVHPKLEPSLSLGPSPHQQQEEAHSPQRPSTPEEYIQDTAAPFLDSSRQPGQSSPLPAKQSTRFLVNKERKPAHVHPLR